MLSRISCRGIAGTTKSDVGSITVSDQSKPLRQLCSVAYQAEHARSMEGLSASTARDGEYGLVIFSV
ncbi:hypothetical protein [Rhodopirellula halodulae]|uniref:hypothetical protein n=1 Tax=Rhodopirellula halodulae TaxID=2894198 RepID=UPI001E594847|nr:hypothetical protein [Rhodopirellula sp. JC737]